MLSSGFEGKHGPGDAATIYSKTIVPWYFDCNINQGACTASFEHF